MVEPTLSRADITGIVLAGGRGSRMGGIDKAWSNWRGRPMIETVIERLRPQVGTIVVSANRNRERYEAMGVVTVSDSAELEPYSGPLAGLHSALAQVATRWALVVPCDAPHLPADLAQRLSEGVRNTGSPAAVAWVGGQVEPLFCLLAARLWLDLDRALAEGQRSPMLWLKAVGAAEMPIPDAAAFANINTLDELGRP